MTDIAQTFIDQSRTFLSREYLPRIEQCLEQLTDEQVWWRPNENSNSIGNLLLHLNGNMRQWIVSSVGGAVDQRKRQQEFDQRAIIPRHALIATLRTTVAESDAVLEHLQPAILLERRLIQGNDVSVFEAVYHVVEHFSMHTGQIILLAKLQSGKDLAFYKMSDGVPRPQWNTREAKTSV
jgi:uncharacterized damage-inducible protein DinB